MDDQNTQVIPSQQVTTEPPAQVENAQPAQPVVSNTTPVPSAQVTPGVSATAVISQVASQDDTLNPASISTSREKAPLNIEFSGELPAGMQSVESLRSPEISPEVEKFIEEVKEEPNQFTKEVVLADQQMIPTSQPFISQPVIVLPMTQQEFEEGKKLPPTESKRWLAEWTEKIRKIFAGNVVFGG